MDDTIQIGRSSKTVANIIKSDKKKIFSLIKDGYSFTDEVLSATGIKKTVSNVNIDYSTAYEREKINLEFEKPKSRRKKKEVEEDNILTFYEDDDLVIQEDNSNNSYIGDDEDGYSFTDEDINLMLHPEDYDEEGDYHE